MKTVGVIFASVTITAVIAILICMHRHPVHTETSAPLPVSPPVTPPAPTANHDKRAAPRSPDPSFKPWYVDHLPDRLDAFPATPEREAGLKIIVDQFGDTPAGVDRWLALNIELDRCLRGRVKGRGWVDLKGTATIDNAALEKTGTSVELDTESELPSTLSEADQAVVLECNRQVYVGHKFKLDGPLNSTRAVGFPRVMVPISNDEVYYILTYGKRRDG